MAGEAPGALGVHGRCLCHSLGRDSPWGFPRSGVIYKHLKDILKGKGRKEEILAKKKEQYMPSPEVTKCVALLRNWKFIGAEVKE